MQWLEHERITIVNTVPSLAQLWLAHAPASISLRAMRWVFFAGEPLTEALVRKWRATFSGGGEIINLYGPTETTMVKCFYRVPAEPLPGVQPAGWPMPQTQALVLTDRKRLCGIGEPGGVSCCAHPSGPWATSMPPRKNRIASPRTHSITTRETCCTIRATGADIGPTDYSRILGRLDDQVKIRGVRVEPGEVTAILARHPAVEACVVISRKQKQGETYLAAYVVASREERATAGQLRTYLSQQLPAALVPTAFVFLEQLPLTPSGKVDRNALPEPDGSLSQLGAAYAAPRTPGEEALASIWAQVLGVERVGVHDNFFDLGGHSLLGIRLLALINKTLNVELPLAALFQAPTIEELAATVDREKGSVTAAWSPLVSMRLAGSRPPLFVVPGNVGNVFTDLGDLAQYLGPEQPFYGLQDGAQNPVSVDPNY